MAAQSLSRATPAHDLTPSLAGGAERPCALPTMLAARVHRPLGCDAVPAKPYPHMACGVPRRATRPGPRPHARCSVPLPLPLTAGAGIL
jgi:hypothetical protein